MRDELTAVAAELTRQSDTPTEPVADVTADVQAETEPEQEAPIVETLAAPESWSAERRETFSKLPREAQEILLARHKEMESDYTRKTTELANQRKTLDEINAVLEPYKQEMELAGVRPNDVVQRLLAAQKFLQTNPIEGVKWLAQQFNVDLASLSPKDEAYVDPTVKALKQELDQLKASIQQREATAQNQQVATAQKIIRDFVEAKAEDGTAKYPHYETLKGLMAPIVATGKTLEEAYELASYTLPEVRERIASEAAKAAQADAVKKAEEARKAKAKEVKGAAQVIRSRGTAVEDTGKTLTLRQELEKNLRESGGRI